MAREDKFAYTAENTEGMTVTPPEETEDPVSRVLGEMITAIEEALAKTGFTEEELNAPIEEEEPEA